MTSAHPSLRAKPGDSLVIHGHHVGEPAQDAEILETLGDDGGPLFVVRWEDGHVSRFYPSSDVHVQHFEGVKVGSAAKGPQPFAPPWRRLSARR